MFSAPVFYCFQAYYRNAEEPIETAVVCLQPSSADLRLQVLIVATHFKGLVGSVPTAAACCCSCGPIVSMYARRRTQNEQLGD